MASVHLQYFTVYSLFVYYTIILLQRRTTGRWLSRSIAAINVKLSRTHTSNMYIFQHLSKQHRLNTREPERTRKSPCAGHSDANRRLGRFVFLDFLVIDNATFDLAVHLTIGT